MATQGRKKIATGGKMARRLLGAAVGGLLLCGAAAADEMRWPTVAIPQGVESFAVGGEVAVNGLPLRMRGVLSPKSPDQVAALFRASLGRPLVENAQGAKLVLGRALGEFYTTVQLEAAGTGTRGLIAVTRLAAAVGRRDDSGDAGQRILSRFPLGSRLVSRMSSVDGMRRADSLALSNAMSAELNVEHLRRMLTAEGYTFERATSPADIGKNATSRTAREGATLFFTRRGAEAVAVVFRDGGGNTAIVLNTVTDLELAK